MAQNFTELFFASAIVAAGEAGVLPIAYALIPELFHGKQRVLANSIFAVGGRLGQGMVLSLCGYLIFYVDTLKPSLPLPFQSMETWRLAFFAAALPGLLVIGLVLSMSSQAKSSRKRVEDLALSTARANPDISVFAFIQSHSNTFISFFVGMGLFVFGLSAIGAFLPVVAMRQMGATPVQLGNFMGIATLVSSLLGLLITQTLAKFLRPRLGDRYAIIVLIFSALLTALSTSTLLAANNVRELFFLVGIQMTFLMCGMMTFPNVIQDMTARNLRARLVAIIIMVNTVGGSLSPALVGAISDQFKDRPDGLIRAAVGTSCISLLLATAILWQCQRTYAATVASAKATDNSSG
jgi:MFS family permease